MTEAPDARTIAATIRANLNLQRGERLYTIVDACQDKELAFEAKTNFKQPIRSLFSGAGTESMADYAPYFIPIDLESEYLERWCESWKNNAGILLVSLEQPLRLYNHLRDIFVVKDEKGQDFFFRYYDPRVVRTFLPTCTSSELRIFFGPISRILCRPDNVSTLSTYTSHHQSLTINIIDFKYQSFI